MNDQKFLFKKPSALFIEKINNNNNSFLLSIRYYCSATQNPVSQIATNYKETKQS